MDPLPSVEELRSACTGHKSQTIAKARDHFNTLLNLLADDSASLQLQIEAKDRMVSIKDILKDDEELCNVLMDVIWFETSMASSTSDDYEVPKPLVDVLDALVQAAPSVKGPLSELLDASLLQKCGIIENEAEFNKKLRMTNTQTHYKQQKFNLLVEESEGFSKFLTAAGLLLDHGSDNSPVVSNDSAFMLKVIATFSLDPNRCLALLLDVLERELGEADDLFGTKKRMNTKQESRLDRTLGLIEALSLQKLPSLVAFKLNEATDKKSVLKCAAFLAVRKLMDLEDFLTFLPEWADVLQSSYDALRKQDREAVRAMGRVRLSSKRTEEKKTAVDLSPISTHATTHLVRILLDWKKLEVVEALFQPYWSMLCYVFPDQIGCLICDIVEGDLENVYGRVCGEEMGVPWVESNVQKEAEHGNGEQNNQKVLLQVVRQRLMYTRESGCFVQRPALFFKICRILSIALKTEQPIDECMTFLREFLVPGLSLFKCNAALSQEFWKFLERLNYKTRYSFYKFWRGAGLERNALLSDKPLWLIRSEIVAGKEARHALKRVSKDTIRDASRAIAKVCHSHPLVAFSTILGQIESYDNLVHVMVEGLKDVTPLSLDVLGFCILSRLDGSAGGFNRSRLKEDGVNVSQWLQSLESFIGALYKRFPFLELSGITAYLMGRVSSGHVMELGVLRTLLKESGGWAFADYAPAASLSSTQLEGRAGSTDLKRETMSFGVVPVFNERASDAVRHVLQKNDVGVALLLLLAQIPHQIIFDTSSKPEKPVKLIGNLVDTCQVTMAILLDFLTQSSHNLVAGAHTSQSTIWFAKSMPSLLSLCTDYKFDVAVAWMLTRPLVRAATSAPESGAESALDVYRLSEATRKGYNKMVPAAFWDHVSHSLFETFYVNTLYDIFCPEAVYKTEIDRLEREEERLLRTSNAATNEDPNPAAERAKKAAVTLGADQESQKKHVAAFEKTMESQAGDFFVAEANIRQAATFFFAHCVYPRCMQGPDDALYCSRFILQMHRLQVPGFSTMHLFDIMIVASSRSMFGMTEGEAANISILLCEIWKTVSRWRYNEEAFNSELAACVGSKMVNADEDGAEKVESITYKRFSELYNKWHAAIGSTCLGCLQSREYIHPRNALIVLTRIVEIYPTRPGLANRLLSDLQPLQDESYPFADLRASAQAYSTQLVKARDDGVWKEETAEAREARIAEEQAAAAARQRKAEEQMEQIKRDSERITEEIGEKELWGRGDRDRRAPTRPRGPGQEDGWRESNASTPVKDTGSSRNDAWSSRDRSAPGRGDPSSTSSHMPRGGRDSSGAEDARRAPDGRWQKGPGDNRGAKRSRPSSPADPGEIQEESSRNKRSRQDGDNYRRRRRN